jgi:hypothetical protein
MAASGLVVPGGGGGATEHLDTFTDSNGTLITSHTPDTGNGYSVLLGAASSIEIQSNECRVGEAIGPKCFITDISDVSGFQIDAQFRMESGGHIHGFFFATQPGDTSNFYYALFMTLSPNRIRIGREGHGGTTALAETNKTLSLATNYDVTLVVTGSDITFTYDGTSCNTAWTPPASAYSYIGVYSLAVSPSFTFVDDLTVTPS